LRERLAADLRIALKGGDRLRTSVLRLVAATIKNREVEKRAALDEAEVVQVLRSAGKQRRESIEQFRAGGREDLARAEEAELQILEAYLPAALSPAELRQEAQAAIAAVGATSPKDLGRVMARLMPVLAGRAEGKVVNTMVRELLAGG
jgi:uncharacterized protein YqeY